MNAIQKVAAALFVAVLAMPMSAYAVEEAQDVLLEAQATDPHPASFTSCSVSPKVAKVGDTVTISYEVSDPEGVASVSPIFSVGEGDSGFQMSTTADTTKSFPFVVDGDTGPGTYSVVGLEVRDSLGFVTTFGSSEYAARHEGCIVKDFSGLSFEVQASTDPHPATFTSCSVAPKVACVGDTVTISYNLSDPDGVASVSPIFSHGEGVSGYQMTTTADTVKAFPFKVDGETDPGTYSVVGLRVWDSTGYVTTFATEEYAKQNDGCVVVDLSAATFEVLDEISSRTYEVLDGDNSVWTIGSSKPLTIRFAGPYDQFAGLTVDNVGVPEDLYEAESGSTVVKLSASYLETLGEGEHKVTAKYKDGSTSTATVKIQAPSAGSGGDQNQGAQDQGVAAGSNGGTSAPATGTRQTTTLAKTGDDQTAAHLGLTALLMGSLAVFGAGRRMGRRH